MKKTIVMSLVILILIISKGFAELNTNLEKEIMTYESPDVEIIAKSRKMLTDNIASNNLNKVEEIYDYLLEKYQDESKIVALWTVEKTGILFCIRDYNKIKDIILSYNESMYEKTLINPEQDILYSQIIDYLGSNYNEIIVEISTINLPVEERLFLKLLLNDFYIGYQEEYTQAELNYECTVFLVQYPDSEYSDFIKKYLRYIIKPGNWGYGYELFGGSSIFKGDISRYFSSGPIIGMDFEISYKNINNNILMYLAYNDVKRDFEYKEIWAKGDHLHYALFTNSIGYQGVETSKFKFIPFVTVGGAEIAYSKDGQEKPKVKFSFAYGSGFSIDYKLSSSVRMNYYYTKNGSYFIRLKCGFVKNNFDRLDDRFSGNTYYFNIGIGGYIRPLKRYF